MNRDIIELREVIKKLVPLLTGKDLQVTQRGSRAYVAVNRITGKPEFVNIPNISDDAEPSFVRAIQGFLDHEVAHVLITNFDDYLVKGDPTDPKIQRLQHLCNMMEDTMVEREICKIFPGSLRNIADLRSHYIEKICLPAMKDAKDELDFFRRLLIVVLRALAGHREFQDYMDANKYWERPLVKQFVDALPQALKDAMPRMTTTKETRAAAEIIEGILHPKEQEEQPQPPQKSENGKGKGKKEHEKDSDQASGGESGESEDEGDTGEGEDAGSESKDASSGEQGGASAGADEAPDEAKDEEAEMPESKGSPNKPSKDEEEAGDDAGADDKDADDGADEDPDEEAEQPGAGSEEDVTDTDDEAPGLSGDDDADDDNQDGDEKPAESPADEDDDAGEEAEKPAAGEDEADEDLEEPSEAAAGEEDSADQDDDSDGDGDTDGETDSGNGGDQSSEDDGDNASEAEIGDEGSDEQDGGGVGGGVSKSVFDFPDDAFEEADMSSQISIQITKDAVKNMKASDYTVFTRELDRIEPLVPPNNINERWIPALEEEVRQMTGRMQKDIERMMASQSRILRIPGYRSGRLHGANLHRILAGDDRVFNRREEHKSKDTAVTLLIDNSGSMEGEKLRTAMIAAFALSSTLERVSIAHEMIGFTTGDWANIPKSIADAMQEEYNAHQIRYSRTIPITMPIYKSFDERINATVKKRVAYMANAQKGLGGNIDGESLEYAAMRLIKRPEKRKVIIVLSDGHPAGATNADEHLAMTVQKMAGLGIDCVGIGIMDASVKHFYPKSVVLSKISDLPGEVMKELKSILTN